VRVLVTGAGGYVGGVVAARLAADGHEVTALVHTARPDQPVAFADLTEVVAADLRDPAAIAAAGVGRGFDAVCHLAALTRVRDSLADPLHYYGVNLTGTLVLLEALAAGTARTGVAPRVVLASTCAVYGETTEPAGEDAPTRPASPYARSKLAAEQVLADQAAAGAVGAVAVRCFNVAGAVGRHGDPDTTRVIPKAVAVAAGLAPELSVLGDGSAVREYVHVADLAGAYSLALEAAEPGRFRVYNVGSGAATSVNDVVAAVEACTGRPLPVAFRPAAPEAVRLLADSSRVRAELGWTPTRSAITDIVADAWEWQRARLASPRSG
jgi:UDP-glucose 4-epimerase